MRLGKLIQTFNHYLYYFAAVPLVAATVLTVFDVTGRYFRHPIPGTLELSAVSLALVIALTLAHTQAVKGHIDVDILFNFMPPRVQAIVNVVTMLLSLIFVGLMTWRAWYWLSFSQRTQELVSIVRWPMWPFKAALLFGFFCLTLQLLLDVIHYSRQLVRHETEIGAFDLEEMKTKEL